MFVRWKKRKLAGEGTPGVENISLYAVLVENHRIDGKIRQKVVRYLGYINEARINDQLHQRRFWQQVDQNMQGLQLNRAEQLSLAGKIMELVPRPRALKRVAGIGSKAHSTRYVTQ